MSSDDGLCSVGCRHLHAPFGNLPFPPLRCQRARLVTNGHAAGLTSARRRQFVNSLSHRRAGWHPTGSGTSRRRTLALPGEITGREPLSTAVIGTDGIRGDRVVRVRGPEGVRTSRRQYRLLGLRGTLDPDDGPRINSHPWNSPEALALVKGAAGADAWLEAWEGLDRSDDSGRPGGAADGWDPLDPRDLTLARTRPS
jgi:hypothetical protein